MSFVIVVAAAGGQKMRSLLLTRLGPAGSFALFDRREHSGEVGAAIMVMTVILALGRRTWYCQACKGLGCSQISLINNVSGPSLLSWLCAGEYCSM